MWGFRSTAYEPIRQGKGKLHSPGDPDLSDTICQDSGPDTESLSFFFLNPDRFPLYVDMLRALSLPLKSKTYCLLFLSDPWILKQKKQNTWKLGAETLTLDKRINFLKTISSRISLWSDFVNR